MKRNNADQNNANAGVRALTPQSSRRHFLRFAAHALAVGALPSMALAHGDIGAIRPPLAIPNMTLTRQDGKRIALQQLLVGKATALQFMFTGCSQICPLQGALFSAVQTRMQQRSVPNAQLVSLTIDPLGDDARALQAWLRKFGAGPQWLGLIPAANDLEKLRVALGQSADRLDNHTGQIFLFDKHGMLVWRTEDLPSATDIAGQLERIARA